MIRKLQSDKDHKKKQKKNQLILGAVLIFVMFGSVFAVVVGSFNNEQTKEIVYNGAKFQQEGNYYSLNLGETKFYFLSNPNDYESISYDFNSNKTILNFASAPLYIQSEDTILAQEIAQNIGQYAQRVQLACINETDCLDETLPIKDCSNNLIILKQAQENKIYDKDSCLIIEGKQEDLLSLTDIAILKMLQIN